MNPGVTCREVIIEQQLTSLADSLAISPFGAGCPWAGLAPPPGGSTQATPTAYLYYLYIYFIIFDKKNDPQIIITTPTVVEQKFMQILMIHRG